MVRFEDWEDLPYNFSTDFYIAAVFGEKSVRQTYDECIEEHQHNYKVLARIIFDTNLMGWYFYQQGESAVDEKKKEMYHKFGQLFSDLYYESRDLFFINFENDKEAFKYYFEKLD